MKPDIIIRFIFGMIFMQGLMRYIGIPGLYINAIIEISILLFFIASVYVSFVKRKTFNLPVIVPFFIFSLAVFLSIVYNDSDIYNSFLMYRQFMWPYLFFVAVYNLNISAESLKKINKFIIFFILLQIPAAVYKYLMFGMREGTIIGTFANNSGSLSTIFPLFIIGYLISLYLVYKKKPIYLLLIIGFMFFAWGGGKRGFFFILPVLILAALCIHNLEYLRSLNIGKVISMAFIMPILIVSIFYIAGRALPTLNPEQKVGGNFDFEFMINYLIQYETRTGRETQESRGRISTTRSIYYHFMEVDLNRKILGDGPDRLYNLEESGDARYSYGFGYGMTGVIFTIIGVGLVGTLSLFYLYVNIGLQSKKLLKTINDPFYKAIAFGTILATLVFCFDFLIYSRAFLFRFMPSVLFFYIVAMLIKINNHNRSIRA
jgi:hypothetical protein